MSSNRKPAPRKPAPRTPVPTTGVRLQKVIAAAGVASRRAAEELIEQGRVTVDGKTVRVQGMRVDPAVARIEVDGERINVHPRREYLMLNKPPGVVSTASDPAGRPTVVDLVRARGRVYPVGRLDAETTGLLLLTDHGDLSHRLTHPRFGIERIYLAEIAGEVPPAAVERLRTGVTLEDGPARAARAIVRRRSSKRAHVEIVMTEGRKHEVRRMLEAVDLPLVRLARVGFGPLRLGTLPLGESRPLTPTEVGQLMETVGL